MARIKSLFSLGNSIKEDSTQKLERKPKIAKPNNPVIDSKKKSRSNKNPEHYSTLQNESLSQTPELTNIKWCRTSDKLPDDLRPIEFNTAHKKQVRGYRLRSGYITDAPYFIDNFKKQNGYIEWRYINYCTTLSKCPQEFPSCEECKLNRRMK